MLSASDFYGDSDIPVFTRISDNIYLINNTGDFLYESKTSDGTTIFEYSSMTYIQSDTVKNEFVAVIIFVMIIIVTIILLVIKGIRKIVKKYKVSPTGKAILTGQFARFVIGLFVAKPLADFTPAFAAEFNACFDPRAEAARANVPLPIVSKACFASPSVFAVMAL